MKQIVANDYVITYGKKGSVDITPLTYQERTLSLLRQVVLETNYVALVCAHSNTSGALHVGKPGVFECAFVIQYIFDLNHLVLTINTETSRINYTSKQDFSGFKKRLRQILVGMGAEVRAAEVAPATVNAPAKVSKPRFNVKNTTAFKERQKV